jgi:hypothetical protein
LEEATQFLFLHLFFFIIKIVFGRGLKFYFIFAYAMVISTLDNENGILIQKIPKLSKVNATCQQKPLITNLNVMVHWRVFVENPTVETLSVQVLMWMSHLFIYYYEEIRGRHCEIGTDNEITPQRLVRWTSIL